MAQRPPTTTPIAGGFLIASGAILGTAIGLFTVLGPTRGFLIGLAAGTGISVAIWALDLRK